MFLERVLSTEAPTINFILFYINSKSQFIGFPIEELCSTDVSLIDSLLLDAHKLILTSELCLSIGSPKYSPHNVNPPRLYSIQNIPPKNQHTLLS